MTQHRITLHKYGGRLMFISMLIAMHMGFYKLKQSKIIQLILFDAFLVFLAIINLTNFIYIKPLWRKIKI